MSAFDWVDYVLYLLATLGFATPIVFLLSGWEIPNWLGRYYELGIAPTLLEQAALQLLGFIFLIFVVAVYLRNYIVMHSIDNRRAFEFRQYEFVNYTEGRYGLAERIFRALIVLWVLTSTLGAVPLITRMIQWIPELIVTASLQPAAAQKLNSFENFFTYYGFVVVILFLLFIAWDISNVASIGARIRRGEFKNENTDRPGEYERLVEGRHVGSAIPSEFRNSIVVYSLVSYMRPLLPVRSELAAHPIKTQPLKRTVSAGNLLRVYLGSSKLGERLLGVGVGVVFFVTPWVPDSWVLAQAMLAGFLLALYVFSLRHEWQTTATRLLNYCVAYFITPNDAPATPAASATPANAQTTDTSASPKVGG